MNVELEARNKQSGCERGTGSSRGSYDTSV